IGGRLSILRQPEWISRETHIVAQHVIGKAGVAIEDRVYSEFLFYAIQPLDNSIDALPVREMVPSTCALNIKNWWQVTWLKFANSRYEILYLLTYGLIWPEKVICAYGYVVAFS